jgi:hypothetical protein
MWLLVVPIALMIGLDLLGADQLNTTSLHPPFAFLVVGGWSIFNFRVFLRAYLSNDKPNERIKRLQKNRRGTWVLLGIMFAALMTAISGYVACQLVKTTAQYIPGELHRHTGEVTAVRQSFGRGPCKFYATVTTSGVGEELHACVKVNFRDAIGPLDLQAGEQVTAQLKVTMLGSVVLEIRRAN